MTLIRKLATKRKEQRLNKKKNQNITSIIKITLNTQRAKVKLKILLRTKRNVSISSI